MVEEKIEKQLDQYEDDYVAFDKNIFEKAYEVNCDRIRLCDLEIKKWQKMLHMYDSSQDYYRDKYMDRRRREDKNDLDDVYKKRLNVYNKYIYALLNKDINVRRRYLDTDMHHLCDKWGNINKKEYYKRSDIIQEQRIKLVEDEMYLMIFYMNESKYELIEPLVAKNTEAKKVEIERTSIVHDLED
jgi:hypothetical protein